ncbi:hypothetical protein HYDPIDRAFT_120534, partial [Hydnomerulius pinastri MD-312]
MDGNYSASIISMVLVQAYHRRLNDMRNNRQVPPKPNPEIIFGRVPAAPAKCDAKPELGEDLGSRRERVKMCTTLSLLISPVEGTNGSRQQNQIVESTA